MRAAGLTPSEPPSIMGSVPRRAPAMLTPRYRDRMDRHVAWSGTGGLPMGHYETAMLNAFDFTQEP